MTVPYIFATATGNVPLTELDANFAAVSNNVSTANTALTAETVTIGAQPNITSVGTLTSLSVAGNVTAKLFVGNITGLITNAVYANTAGISTFANSAALATVATTAGTVTVGAQPAITSVGTLTSLNVAGNVKANLFVGNITGSIANATYATTAGFATTADTANSATTATSATTAGTANSATIANTANSATTAGTVTTAAQPNITSVGTLTGLSVTGNINAGNVIATNLSGPIFLAYQTTPQSLSNGNANVIYNTATVNSSNYYNSTTGIFQPLVPGYYQVNATIFPGLISGTPSAGFFLALYKNGSTVLSAGADVVITPTWGTITLSSVSVLVPFNGTTDYINCKICSSITSGTWTTQAGVPSYFQACWIRGI